MVILLTALMSAMLLTGCEKGPEVVDESLPGSVFVIANNEKFEGFAHRVYGKTKEGVSEKTPLPPGDVADELASVAFSDDLMLYVKGDTASPVRYSLYDVLLEPIYEDSADLTAPEYYSGVTYLRVDVEWGDAERSEGYEYFFKFYR